MHSPNGCLSLGLCKGTVKGSISARSPRRLRGAERERSCRWTVSKMYRYITRWPLLGQLPRYLIIIIKSLQITGSRQLVPIIGTLFRQPSKPLKLLKAFRLALATRTTQPRSQRPVILAVIAQLRWRLECEIYGRPLSVWVAAMPHTQCIFRSDLTYWEGASHPGACVVTLVPIMTACLGDMPFHDDQEEFWVRARPVTGGVT